MIGELVRPGTGITTLNLGERREPLQPVLEQVTDLGIYLNPQSISSMRSGRYSGNHFRLLYACAEKREANDPSLKDAYYEKVALGILDARVQSQTWPYKYNSHGLTADVAKHMGVGQRDFRAGLTCMRADFLSALTPADVAAFQDAIFGYFRKHTAKNTATDKMLREFYDNWDLQIGSFYQFLKDRGTGVAKRSGGLISSITATEAEYMREHFKRRLRVKKKLSPFDKGALGAIKVVGVKDDETQDVPDYSRVVTVIDDKEIQELIGRYPLNMNRNMVITHMKAIAEGNPNHRMKEQHSPRKSPTIIRG